MLVTQVTKWEKVLLTVIIVESTVNKSVGGEVDG